MSTKCFREDQADEYSSLRRELEQTIKNCRVLSFKLKKTERRADQLEQEKAEQEKKLLEVKLKTTIYRNDEQEHETIFDLIFPVSWWSRRFAEGESYQGIGTRSSTVQRGSAPVTTGTS